MNWRFWKRPSHVSPSQLRFERELARVRAHSYRTKEVVRGPSESELTKARNQAEHHI